MGDKSETRRKERRNERKLRKLQKNLERRKQVKNWVTRQRFLILTTLFMFSLVFLFTTTVFVVVVTTGIEPSALVSGFFDFVKWEFAGLSLIKVSENLGLTHNSKGEKLKEVVEDGATILDNTAELMRDVSDIGTPDLQETPMEDGDPN